MSNICRLLRLDFLPSSTHVALLVLRVWIGTTMLTLHGAGKIAKLLEPPVQFPDYFGIGSTASLGLVIFGEVVCSVLLVLGLFTRFAALAGGITMAVAFFLAHKAVLAGDHNGEMAFIYLATYVTLFLAGAGRISLDARRCGTTTDA